MSKFRHLSTTPLTQGEKEAIVDLLHFCIYADAHIAATEGDFVTNLVDEMKWETQRSFSSFEGRSIANARAACASEETRKDFLEDIARRITAKPTRTLTKSLCKQLFAVDDATAPKEDTLLSAILGYLK